MLLLNAQAVRKLKITACRNLGHGHTHLAWPHPLFAFGWPFHLLFLDILNGRLLMVDSDYTRTFSCLSIQHQNLSTDKRQSCNKVGLLVTLKIIGHQQATIATQTSEEVLLKIIFDNIFIQHDAILTNLNTINRNSYYAVYCNIIKTKKITDKIWILFFFSLFNNHKSV